MKIVEMNVFAGPSLHSSRPVITVKLDMGLLAGWNVARLDFARRADVARLLPTVSADALADHTTLPDLYAHLLAAIQRSAGRSPVTASAESLGIHGQYRVTAEYEAAQIAQQAARLAAALMIWMAPAHVTIDAAIQTRLAPAAVLRRFQEGALRFLLDQTTFALVQEAERRDIPWYRPIDFEHLVQFGQGARQIRIRETVTGHTNALALTIAKSKSRTHHLLVELGLPTTRQLVVRSEEEAVRAAEVIGYPVVVKPEDRGKSLAVSVGLRDRHAVVAAFQRAQCASQTTLVEAVVPGNDHRLLVVDGKLVAAAQRLPAHVVGDGRRTVEALVDELNSDPRRGVGFTKQLVRVNLDDEADRMLTDVGLVRTSVPESGQRIVLRSATSISAGGTSMDVTLAVHPDNRIAAERAARIVGLDVAGVDFMTPDIRRSWREVGGAILEINPSPGLRPHWNAEGSPDVTSAVMDSIVPPGTRARIPLAAITGTNGKTTTTLLTAHILGLDGRVVGTATTHGVRVGGDTVARGDLAGSRGARMLLLDPLVDAAVVETARRGLISVGLNFDWCDVGAVLNVGSDHVGMDGIAKMEDMAQLKRLAVARARHMAVLNADDPLCIRLAEGLVATRLCYVSFAPDNPLVRLHVDAGHPAVWLDETGVPTIVLHDGSVCHELNVVADIPIAMGGAARHNIQNAMFAAAVAFGLGEKLDTIRTGLRTFVSDPSTNPGRFNLYSRLPFRVMVEYAHNAEALATAAAFVRGLDVTGRRLVVLWSQGNRIDSHYASLARAAAGGFDRFVCMEPPNPRGRAPGDVSGRLAAGLREAGVSVDRIDIVPNEDAAIARVLDTARAGDFVLICCRDYEAAWRQITSFQPQ